MAARVESLDSRRRPRRTAVAALPAPAPRVVRALPPALRRPRTGLREILRDTVNDLWELFTPDVVRELNDEVAARLRRMPTQTNEYGYDPWGLNVDVARQALVVSALLYRYYFRVEAIGIEHIPDGRVLVISNHAGQVAIDAAMIGTATVLEREPPRIVRGMGEYWLPTVPFVNLLMSRTGSVVGTPKNCADLLAREEAVIAFPEGVHGMNKLFSERYRLQRFGSGFMRLALSTRTPIVPVAVIGSEEQAPAIANLTGLGRLLGMPAFPVTVTWPWLGPLGLLPLPTKYRIYFGKPMRFEGNPDDEDAVIDRKVQKVVDTIQGMIDKGLREREGIFF
ncbi:MAG TPA: lysophospholipid acyltransferase family protein [Candidatus Dormibacteraeota bacterium]|nr:lysophospholipid acyltransferase family protein [Candidatus Dormibacteraeota bacterium]